MTANLAAVAPSPLARPIESGAARPFDRAGLLGRVRPFAWVAAVAVAAVAVAPPSRQPGFLAAGAIATAAVIVVALFAPWSRLPRWADLVPPLVYVAAVALLRHAGGGAGSGLVTLHALPLVWVALYGSRRDVGLILAAVSAVTIIPIIVVGAPAYPFEEWRRAALSLAIGALVGFTVNGLTSRIRGHLRVEAERSAAIADREARLRAVLETANDAIVTIDPQGLILDVNAAALEMFRGSRDDLVGRDLVSSLAVEEEHAFLRTGLARLATDHDGAVSRRFGTELIRLDGSVFPAEVSVGVVFEDGQVRVHCFARDVSERRAAEAAAAQHLEDLGALLAIARDLSTPETAPEVRSTICHTAARLSGATLVTLLEPVDEELLVTAWAGQEPTVTRVPIAGSAAGSVFRHGKPVFSGDIAGDPRITSSLRDVAAAGGLKAAYWHPIGGSGGITGILTVFWADQRAVIDPRLDSLLGLFASQAGVALEMAQLVTRLEGMARTDGLTSIANRRTFDESLEAEMERAGRSGSPLCLLMLDLDHFKRFNDSRGHQAGDHLLVDAAAAWTRELRPTDVLARYGGEEFAVVLPDCSPAAAMRVAERLRSVVPAGQTVSVGVATWDGVEDETALVKRADSALYRAKEEGRDRTIAA